MSFNYTVSFSDPAGTSHKDQVLMGDMQEALSQWSKYINGIGTLAVDVNITETAIGTASGGPTATYAAGTNNGKTLYESSALYELTSGSHVQGTTSDITVNVSPSFEKQLDLRHVLTASSPIAADKLNPVTVFMHELEHGFGQVGFINVLGKPESSNYESTFDQYVQEEPDGTAYFTGPEAEAIYGGPVQLTTATGATLAIAENYYHFSNMLLDAHRTAKHAHDPLSLDLMNGIVFHNGRDYLISPLDVGVLSDLGYSVNIPAHNSAFSFALHAAHVSHA